ncbi:MAG: hypothetical protein KDD35_02220 [Bdellovibrionales bacterium]|nr:hypothetical protein [Bdellovibrionales bacterium]
MGSILAISRSVKKYLPLLMFLLLLIVPFQNCAKSSKEEGPLQQEENPSLNIRFCGFEGFQYLHQNYFKPHCSACHEKGGLAFPSFADDDVEHSYSWTRSISPKSLWDSSTNNRFCGEECSLKPSDPLYQQLREWLENQDSCE